MEEQSGNKQKTRVHTLSNFVKNFGSNSSASNADDSNQNSEFANRKQGIFKSIKKKLKQSKLCKSKQRVTDQQRTYQDGFSNSEQFAMNISDGAHDDSDNLEATTISNTSARNSSAPPVPPRVTVTRLDMDDTNSSPIYYAISENNEEIVRYSNAPPVPPRVSNGIESLQNERHKQFDAPELNRDNTTNNAPPIPPRVNGIRNTLDTDTADSINQYLDIDDFNEIQRIISRLLYHNGTNESANERSKRSPEINNLDKGAIKQSVLAKEIHNLANHGWFWGPLSKDEAEGKLHAQPDGSFLIRDSRSDRHIFTLSFRSYGQTLHTHIEYSCGVFAIGDYQGPTIADLVTRAVSISENDIFSYSSSRNPTVPDYPVRLIRPLSRFTEVRTLQYLCRFVIRQTINVNNIDKLPLPKSIKGYLHQGQY